MSMQITALNEDSATRVNLFPNAAMPVAVSICESYLPSRALCFLSLRAKRGNLPSVAEIVATVWSQFRND
jgi:hypothetical protein